MGLWQNTKETRRYTGEQSNSSDDTVLHIAVNVGRADIVKKLVYELRRSRWSLSVLEIGYERVETPLHCAAWRGSREMCECIAEATGCDYRLIEARNTNQETPLYLAALQGHREAFLYLQSRCANKTVGPDRRGSDGDTVLHCTIRRDHFELAYEIIHLYGDKIVGSVDEKGITPLHILASKPSAFDSGTNFRRWFTKLAYSCRGTTKKEADPENNNKGEIPLHRAATRKSVTMCKCIVEAGQSMGLHLLGITNKWGETPIFLAALHNRKPAFTFLHNAAAEAYPLDEDKPCFDHSLEISIML